MGGGRRGSGRGSQMQQVKGTVRWESAQTILDALKTPLPEAFADHYVISVSGLPLGDGGRRNDDSGDNSKRSDNMLDNLKAYTSLEPKGKPIAQPGIVQSQPTSGYGSILFGFSKESLDLSADDKEVAFSTQIGRAMIKTKFGERLRSRTKVAQFNELVCKVLCHNICVTIQANYEMGIEPRFCNGDEREAA